MAESTNKPVVDPVKMPKLKTNAKTLAHLNTWAIALSSFVGFFGIFLAISLFTKGKWNFQPAVTTIIPFGAGGANIASSVAFILFLVLMALGLGIYGIITIGKLTDADALKKAWKNVFRTLLFFIGVYALHMFALIITSLVMIGKSSGVGNTTQKTIWLNHFLPSTIMGLAAVALAFLAKSIASGKTANARIASFIGIGLGGVGFILAFIALMVFIYG